MRRETLLSSSFDGEIGSNQNESNSITQNQPILACSLPENFVITDTEALMDISQDNDPSKMKQGILSTFSGVFLIQFMCTWGVVTFLRLGYVVGQAGLAVTVAMFLFGYALGTCTTVSQAILATNDRNLQGGGAYFLVSRAFGPVYGGSMGLIYHVSNLLGGGFAVLGLMEFLTENFGVVKGSSRFKFLPEGEMNEFISGSLILLLSLIICICGTKYFCKVLHVIVIITVAGTLMMYVSLAFRSPLDTLKDLNYKGPNLMTFSENLWPGWRQRIGNNGTSISGNSSSFRYEDFGFQSKASTFGYNEFSEILAIVYPACTGVLGGSSMSGDLKNPGQAIPVGTVMSLITTFFGYMLAVFLLAAGVDRTSLITNTNLVSEIAFIPEFIQAALFAICFYCLLGTIIGEAKMVEAIAKDKILPGMHVFKITWRFNGEPVWGMVYAWFFLECCLLLKKMDLIAPSLTILTISIYLHINLSCFMLVTSSGIVLCIILSIITDYKLTLVSSIIFWVLRKLVARYGPDKYVWGDVGIALSENKLVDKCHELSRYTSRNLPDYVTSKYWKPSTLIISKDHTKSNARFFRWMFGKYVGLSLAASFKPSLDPNVKTLDSRNKFQSLYGMIKYHGFGSVSCNTIILDQSISEEFLSAPLYDLIVREERKNLIISINIDKFEDVAKNTQEMFIDVWLLGRSKTRHQVKSKRGSSITANPSTVGKRGKTTTPLEEIGMVNFSEDCLQTMSDSVYDYGFAFQICEFLRSKQPETFKVRLFIMMKNSESNLCDTISQIKNLFRSIMLPFPEINVVGIEVETGTPESRIDWIKWKLLNPRTKENTAIIIMTLDEDLCNPAAKDFKELGLPMLLVKGSQSTIN